MILNDSQIRQGVNLGAIIPNVTYPVLGTGLTGQLVTSIRTEPGWFNDGSRCTIVLTRAGKILNKFKWFWLTNFPNQCIYYSLSWQHGKQFQLHDQELFSATKWLTNCFWILLVSHVSKRLRHVDVYWFRHYICKGSLYTKPNNSFHRKTNEMILQNISICISRSIKMVLCLQYHKPARDILISQQASQSANLL